MGPYYHIYVFDNEGNWYETDLDRETLLSEIVEPYLSGRDFYCEGHRTNLKHIKIIRIAETAQESSHYKAEMERRGRGVMIDNRHYLVYEIGKDVTREFLVQKEIKEKPRELRKVKFSNRIFIVHGHDELPKEQLARMLKEMGLEPVILHEQPDKGRTIIEKFEEVCEDVGFAFVIITPDDVGVDRELYEKMKVEEYRNCFRYRARQNVVFELGFFYGKLGRNRVCCLYKGNVELLSDISGVLYIEFKDSVRERYADIIKELKAAGYKPKT